MIADVICNGWLFFIMHDETGKSSKMLLKIDGRIADDNILLDFAKTPSGAAEIEHQWREYERRGCPFMSYQAPSWDSSQYELIDLDATLKERDKLRAALDQIKRSNDIMEARQIAEDALR